MATGSTTEIVEKLEHLEETVRRLDLVIRAMNRRDNGHTITDMERVLIEDFTTPRPRENIE